jgi:phosphatidylserine/phosphatidylglycerophosphate/cardiolipin synthase-like enzyme
VLPAGTAALHAKAAIADDHTALVTSANLTGHGMNENMELGLLVRGGPVPRRLAAHFAQLMTDQVLEQVP